MQSWPARLILSTICLVLGFMLVTQIRSLHVDHAPTAQSTTDQATYLSQLYRSNQAQQASLEQIQAEIAKYEQTQGGGSNLVSMLNQIQQLRMINGEIDVAGPGVQVRISNAQNVVQLLQDLTNELRNAGAEAIAVNQIRLVTRSVIAQDTGGQLLVDGQPISAPYVLEAIGDPATLETALERKGGLIALLQEGQGSTLDIKVTRRADGPDGIKLPKTALASTWRYARPATGN
jgi:uncharacterized protein YlxW (UPF0749 family)